MKSPPGNAEPQLGAIVFPNRFQAAATVMMTAGRLSAAAAQRDTTTNPNHNTLPHTTLPHPIKDNSQ